MANQKDLDYLYQSDRINFITTRLGKEPWVNVFAPFDGQSESGHFFCALIPNEQVNDVLSRPSWDLSIGAGSPSNHVFYEDGVEKVEYHHFSDPGAIQPLVIVRNFHGVKPSYVEILEEFRLFHNLFHDARNNKFIKIDDHGEEEEIIQIDKEAVKVKLKAIRQFLAIKGMHLAIYFESVRYSGVTIEGLGELKRNLEVQTEELTYILSIGDASFSSDNDHHTFSRLLGKKLIKGVEIEKSSVWPYNEKEEQYADFIIGVDENGDNIMYSCNSSRLANYFGANPDAPHYLTPVFFNREVLNKYYARPSKFSVEDGLLRCGGLWSLEIDNNHEKYVIVYLGDLGRSLSYSEQLYWKSYNVSPQGETSKVNFQRSILAEFADPESPDLLFKYQFGLFQRQWEHNFGWLLFKPLTEEDAHLYTALLNAGSTHTAGVDLHAVLARVATNPDYADTVRQQARQFMEQRNQ